MTCPSIYSIDETLSGTNTPGRMDMGVMAIKLHFLELEDRRLTITSCLGSYIAHPFICMQTNDYY